jgi:hypothetical protein
VLLSELCQMNLWMNCNDFCILRFTTDCAGCNSPCLYSLSEQIISIQFSVNKEEIPVTLQTVAGSVWRGNTE